jgi:RNA polymerase sigma-70 factor (ECF subfamily)
MMTHRERAPSTDLVLRARSGDRDAFERLVRSHEAGVLAVARRYLRDADAHDVAQRAFVRAYLNLGELRGEAAFGGWVRRIARNLALNLVRERRKVDNLGDAVEDGPDRPSAPSVTGLVATEELRQRLRAAIGRLPKKQRAVVELRLFRESSFRDIARLTDCTEEAAKANFHYATKRLREWLM